MQTSSSKGDFIVSKVRAVHSCKNIGPSLPDLICKTSTHHAQGVLFTPSTSEPQTLHPAAATTGPSDDFGHA